MFSPSHSWSVLSQIVKELIFHDAKVLHLFDMYKHFVLKVTLYVLTLVLNNVNTYTCANVNTT